MKICDDKNAWHASSIAIADPTAAIHACATRRHWPIALSLLDEARAACARLDDPEDEEALHDFRVAVRRLRSLARAHRHHLGEVLDKKRRKRLRDLQRMTGLARDTEVQLEWILGWLDAFDEAERVGIDALTADLSAHMDGAVDGVVPRVKKRFHKLEARVREPIARTEVSLIEVEPETYGAVLGGLARGHVADLADLVSAIGEDLDADATQEAIHDARIAGKRLRYLLEPVRGKVPGAKGTVKRLKALQDVLGDLHDMHVLEGRLEKRLKKAEEAHRPGLEALKAKARAHGAELFATFRARHAGLALADLVDRVETLARRLDGARQTETERKYLLRALPERVKEHAVKELWQGYLPGEKVRERLRRVTRGGETHYLRTIKAGKGLQRVEVEEETTAKVFDVMWPLTEGCRVMKRRYSVPDGALTWVVDEFLDRELVLAEVELPSTEVVPAIPDWMAPVLVREVTGEDEYVNLNLAR